MKKLWRERRKKNWKPLGERRRCEKNWVFSLFLSTLSNKDAFFSFAFFHPQMKCLSWLQYSITIQLCAFTNGMDDEKIIYDIRVWEFSIRDFSWIMSMERGASESKKKLMMPLCSHGCKDEYSELMMIGTLKAHASVCTREFCGVAFVSDLIMIKRVVCAMDDEN